MSEKIKGKPNSNTNDDVVESIFGETLPKEVMENLGWFGRLKKSIISGERKEIPHGLWKQCPECRHTTIKEDIQENFFSVLLVIITIELVVESISIYFLTIKNTLFYFRILALRIF